MRNLAMRPVRTISAAVALVTLMTGGCARQPEDTVVTEESTPAAAPATPEAGAGAASKPEVAQEVIGEWRDRTDDTYDTNLRIVDEGGTFRLQMRFLDGSTGTRVLTERPAQDGERRRFYDAAQGQFYAIQSDTGNLALHDDYGLVRTAVAER